ncbi:MAG: hypothetical protein IPP74_10905 [Alphaproteobacteria bacterium]|jgi:hypothetical protein|nr:hypothetical protein [Alphaproteobacteria bacterium]
MKITSHTTLVVGKAGKTEEVPPGAPVDIDDDEAKDLIARGIAVRVGKSDKSAEKETKEPQGSKPPAEGGNSKPPVDGGKQP